MHLYSLGFDLKGKMNKNAFLNLQEELYKLSTVY